jgi:hypothetical protein
VPGTELRRIGVDSEEFRGVNYTLLHAIPEVFRIASGPLDIRSSESHGFFRFLTPASRRTRWSSASAPAAVCSRSGASRWPA